MDPPELNDDVFTEILRRIPPDDPRVLVRLSVVCKSWRSILTDHAFLDLYRRFHRAPSLLGFYFNRNVLLTPEVRFVRTNEFGRLTPNRLGWYVHDARHGRVLLQSSSSAFAVWNPITGREWELELPEFMRGGCPRMAVLCAVGKCAHLDCHEGSFRVAAVLTMKGGMTLLAVFYSSETGMWSETTTSIPHPFSALIIKPSALVGDTLYFTTFFGNSIAGYDLSNRRLQVLDSPIPDRMEINTLLMTAEGGRLGFAVVQGSKLHLWSMGEAAAAPGVGAMLEWSLTRIIDLDALPGIRGLSAATSPIGFADGVGVIFISTERGVFTIELRSERVQRVTSRNSILAAFPYVSFYTPDIALGRFPALEG